MSEWLNLSMVYWREPLWLLLALQPAILLLLTRARRRKQLRAYADPELHPWVLVNQPRGLLRRAGSRDGAYILAWLLLGLAAAGPRLAVESLDPQGADSVAILLAVDVSRSMTAVDIQPSRLRRAQIEIDELLGSARGARVGVIVYGARAHLYVPPTADYQALRAYLRNLDELVLPTRGSEPAAALSLALEEMENEKAARAVVLITDGDVPADPSARDRMQQAAAALQGQDIPLYVLGVGTVEGAPIPLEGGGWLERDGRAVVSRMQEARLRDLARRGGGRYSVVRDDDSDWETLYGNGIARQRPWRVAEPSSRTVWRELYPYFLFPAILLLFVSLVPYRWSRGRGATVSLLVVVPLLAGLPVDFAHGSEAESRERAAYEAYSAGEFGAAASLYETVPGFAGRMGEGTSYYRRGAYEDAVQAFSQAVLEASTEAQRGKALYNLGNAYFQLGDYANAVVVYDDALRYRPQHPPSQANRSLAQRLLRAVRARRGEQGVTNRAGRGPRSARTEQSIDIDNNTSASIDDSDQQEPDQQEAAEIPELDEARREQLIRRGLDRVRVAPGGGAGTNGGLYPIPRGVLFSAKARMRELEDRQWLLWKRLFEAEEGFPAPLERPRELPGVEPW